MAWAICPEVNSPGDRVSNTGKEVRKARKSSIVTVSIKGPQRYRKIDEDAAVSAIYPSPLLSLPFNP
jgi:hypothetical protein